MPLSLLKNNNIIMKGVTTPFIATGGTSPYTYSVVSGGAGGSIDVNGLYTAPLSLSGDPSKQKDTIQVTDALSETATSTIGVSNDPLKIICEIIANRMSLEADQVYIYNQKFNIPNDDRLYIAIAFLSSKVFANAKKNEEIGGVLKEVLSTNYRSVFSIDIMSRTTEAYNRKEEVIHALASEYAIRLQELNSFKLATIPDSFNPINIEDGAAIPYRFNAAASVLYVDRKVDNSDYYDTFSNINVYTDSQTGDEPVVVDFDD